MDTDMDFQKWKEDLDRRVVERGLDKFQVFRWDVTQPNPHWIMEFQSDNKEKVLSVAKEYINVRVKETGELRYRIRVFDKDNNKDIDITE
jgi:hypothetical protein